MDELRISLHGTALPPGELTLDSLAALAQSLQLLATRVGRHLAGQQGSGRSTAAVERATALRLSGLSAGSAVLAVSIGQGTDAPDSLEHRTFEGLLDVCTGIATNRPPPWTTPLIADAAVSLIDALTRASTICEIADAAGRRPKVGFVLDTTSRRIWEMPTVAERRPGVSVSGRLEAVDLRSSRFRIRDAAGSDIRLDEVRNTADAAPLVGELVTATGVASTGPRGQITGLSEAVVIPTALPRWAQPELGAVVAGATAPPADGIPDLSVDDVTDFLTAIRK